MRYLFVFLMLLSVQAYSQCKEYIIGVKGDTLNCVDTKGRKQGRWVVRVDNVRGERGYEEEGAYLNGQKEGTWRRFSLEGDLVAVENYRWGYKNGQSIYMTPMGDPLREENWKAVNPENPYDTVDVYDPDNPYRIIEKQVVKLEGTSLKHGVWKFYDPMSGRLEKKETWIFDKLKTDPSDEDDLAPIDVSTGTSTAAKPEEKKKVPKPQAVLEYEKKNAGKKKVRTRDGATGF